MLLFLCTDIAVAQKISCTRTKQFKINLVHSEFPILDMSAWQLVIYITIVNEPRHKVIVRKHIC